MACCLSFATTEVPGDKRMISSAGWWHSWRMHLHPFAKKRWWKRQLSLRFIPVVKVIVTSRESFFGLHLYKTPALHHRGLVYGGKYKQKLRVRCYIRIALILTARFSLIVVARDFPKQRKCQHRCHPPFGYHLVTPINNHCGGSCF